MGPQQNFSHKQRQQVVMTHGMRQAVEILQMPAVELESWLDDQIIQNPLIEYKNNHFSLSENYADQGKLEERLCDFLKKECFLLFPSKKEQAIVEALSGFLDQRGFLTSSYEEIATFCQTSPSCIESIAHRISQLEPAGLAAFDVQHSLLLQLEKNQKQNSLAYQLIQNHWDWLVASKHPKLCQHYKITKHELQKIIENDISPLNPYPGAMFQPSNAQRIAVDLKISEINGQLKLEDMDEKYSSFTLREDYIAQASDEPLIRSWLAQAKWFKRILSRRGQLLKKVGQLIIKSQKQYLLGIASSPTLVSISDAAENLEISYTTATRILKNKFISTPRGILPLDFFTTAAKLSKDHHIDSVFQALLACVQSEDKNAPLSDQQIAEQLCQKGMTISRRTVAKYRTKLKIPSVFSRKKTFS